MKSKPTANKYLYSVSDTAKLLSVSRGTVYALMKSGQILAVYPTSQARISAEAIQRFVTKLEKEQRDLCIEVSEVLR
jgi:excisionase family DNA binding protein